MTARWHISPTLAGKPGGRTHYDIGADDNENIALVYPAEDGDDVTVERARLFANARETRDKFDDLVRAVQNLLEKSEVDHDLDFYTFAGGASDKFWCDGCGKSGLKYTGPVTHDDDCPVGFLESAFEQATKKGGSDG